MAVPTIASPVLRGMLDAVAREGGDPAAIAREAELDMAAVDDRDARIPLPCLHAAWEAVLRRAPRVGAGVAGVQSYSPSDYGLVGFVAMNSATLGEGLEHVVRYSGLWTDEPVMSLAGSTLSLVYRTRFPDRLGLRVATEATLAEIVHGARVLTATHIVPREVGFSHAAPDDVSVHTAFFGCAVRFSAPRTAMVLRREDLALPLGKADPKLGAFLREMANQALAKRASEPSPLDRIREVIAEELVRGEPSLERVAKRMATSGRTLRRRLEENGTTFRALLDAARADLARSYVQDRRISLSEVAFMLGFSEPSAFNRAFKRWTDTTPAAWRARGVR
jgi:AraC-like DNA-binding protein